MAVPGHGVRRRRRDGAHVRASRVIRHRTAARVRAAAAPARRSRRWRRALRRSPTPRPFDGRPRWTTADLPGGRAGLDTDVLVREIYPGFFDLLRVPLVAGRTLAPGDVEGRGVLINESMARHFWPGETALGRTFVSHGNRQVVGIVKDTRMYAGNVTFVGPAMYQPIGGRAIPQMLVKHADASAVAAVRALAVALEPRAQIRVAPLSANFARLLDEPRVNAMLADALGFAGAGAGRVRRLQRFRLQRRTTEGPARRPAWRWAPGRRTSSRRSLDRAATRCWRASRSALAGAVASARGHPGFSLWLASVRSRGVCGGRGDSARGRPFGHGLSCAPGHANRSAHRVATRLNLPA